MRLIESKSLFLVVLLLPLVFSIRPLKYRKSSCSIQQPHITYGDYFHSTQPSDAIWTISAVTRDGCKKSDVVLRLSDGTRLSPELKNSYYEEEKNYEAASFFFSITAAQLLGSSSWIMESPTNVLGPFSLPQTSPGRASSASKWLIIADMDESIYSAPTLERLSTLAKRGGFDGVIHNGDYAYNIHNSKGKVGDSYFDSFSKVSARIPYIVTPGNHEYYDSFQMFNYRFQMPGAGNGLEAQAANYYSFIVKGVYFLTINWDYVFTEEGEDNFKEVFEWVRQDLEAMKRNKEVLRKVFFTHKPFYCTFGDEDCYNFYLYKPIESLLYKYEFDVIINSHVHLFYRNKKIDKNFNLVADSFPVPSIIISGHQGVNPDRGGNTNYIPYEKTGVMEKIALAGSPNYLEMDVDETGISFKLKDCFDEKILDQVLISSHPIKTVS